MSGNPFNFYSDESQLATANKTPIGIVQYNKQQDSASYLKWVLENVLTGSTPNFSTVDGSGDDRSGFDLNTGILQAINGAEFWAIPSTEGADVSTLFQQHCLTNRTRLRRVKGDGLSYIGSDIGNDINGGTVFEGVHFTYQGNNEKGIFAEGAYSTTAVVSSLGGGEYKIAFGGSVIQDARVNVGDWVYLPNDSNRRFARITRFDSGEPVVDVPIDTGSGKTVSTQKTGIKFVDCIFDCHVLINNTMGITFDRCLFRNAASDSYRGGIVAHGAVASSSHPGYLTAPNISNCLFVGLANMTAGMSGAGIPTTAAFIRLDNCINPIIANNVFLGANDTAITGLVVESSDGTNNIPASTGGVMIGNAIYNLGTAAATQKAAAARVVPLYDNINIQDGAIW